MAICGLPPLNGFVSEWLIYLGLLHSQAAGTPRTLALVVVAAPMLAMIGALAVACFVKVFGVTFLGAPRQQWPRPITEAPATMWSAMAVLLACCAVIGLLPLAMTPLLGQALAAWGAVAHPQEFPGALAPVPWISLGALLLVALVAGGLLWQRRQEEESRPATWGCGYPWPTARMQYTAASLAEMLTGIFRWGLWTEIKGEPPFGFFPRASRVTDHTPDLVLDRLLYPSCRGLSALAFKVRAFLQHGVMGGYLLYVALTLFLLLGLVIRA